MRKSNAEAQEREPISVGVQTHPGKVRSENQDRISGAHTPFGDLYLVADGVGGQQGGAEAAQYVVDAFVRYLTGTEEKDPVRALKEAAQLINSDLNRGLAGGGSNVGMSSTVVLALIQGWHAIIGHAGDSRAYLVRGAQMRPLTRDHSVIERLIAERHLSPDEAKSHPDASILTQALGQNRDCELETLEFDLIPDDCLLLCSDGLWAYATSGEMHAIVSSPSLRPQAVADALLNLALNNGGGDNVSVQFLRFGNAAPAGQIRRNSLVTRSALLGMGAAAALVAVTAWITVSNLRHWPWAAASKLAHEIQTNLPATPTVSGAITPGAQRVQLVLLSFPHSKAETWQKNLRSAGTVDVVEEQTLPGCTHLLGRNAKLYYTSNSATVARELQSKLNIPRDAMQSVDPQELAPCTTASLVASPATPSVMQEVQRDAGGLKDEMKKRSPINGLPSLPPQ